MVGGCWAARFDRQPWHRSCVDTVDAEGTATVRPITFEQMHSLDPRLAMPTCSRPRRAGIGLGVAFFFVVTFCCSTGEALENARDNLAGIFYPYDPEFIVLEYYRTGTATAGVPRPRLRIHGDGRAVVVRPDYMPRSGTFEKYLQQPDVLGLLQELARQGVLDFDKKRVTKEVRALQAKIWSSESSTRRRITRVSDAGSETLVVWLDQYDPANGSETRTDVRQRVGWVGLRTDVVNYPEINALADLQEALEAVKQLIEEIEATGEQTGGRESVEPVEPVVVFEPQLFELDEKGRATLEVLAHLMKDHEETICFSLESRCDPETDGDECQPLADRRAAAVAAFLIESGVDPRQLETDFPGDRPVPCSYPACRESPRFVHLFSPGIAESPEGCRTVTGRR